MILLTQPGAGQLLWMWDPAWGSWARGVTYPASSKATLTLRVWAGLDLSVKALVRALALARKTFLTGPVHFRAPKPPD